MHHWKTVKEPLSGLSWALTSDDVAGQSSHVLPVHSQMSGPFVCGVIGWLGGRLWQGVLQGLVYRGMIQLSDSVASLTSGTLPTFVACTSGGACFLRSGYSLSRQICAITATIDSCRKLH